MPPEVTLLVIQGALKGKKFVFAERGVCVIGRAVDCNPRLPDDDAHKTISRHHCLLDINPPDIRIRDFGSLNGTFVNGVKIGQRQKMESAPADAPDSYPERDLKNGDEIKLGETVLMVQVTAPAYCSECGAEIPASYMDRALLLDNIYQCEKCAASGEPAKTVAMPSAPKKVCAKCGKNVEWEYTVNRRGDYICSECRDDPVKIVNSLVGHVVAGGDKKPALIEGYKIIKELGRGGMGAVYLAQNEASGQNVAIKVMLPQVAADEASRAMFMREAENTKILDHPNIVRLMDTGYSDGVFFFTMEYCDGGSVDKIMAENGGALAMEDCVGIMLDTLAGLEYIHNVKIPNVKLADGTIGTAVGLVHRDIKPANIFITGIDEKPVAKLADVGLGKAFDLAGLSGQTMTGSAAGTPIFMSRQQVINFKYARPDVDVWALAATFYYMLTGLAPRDFPKSKDPWQIVLQSRAVPIRLRNGLIPEKVARVLDTALIDIPDTIFKTANEFRVALEDALKESV